MRRFLLCLGLLAALPAMAQRFPQHIMVCMNPSGQLIPLNSGIIPGQIQVGNYPQVQMLGMGTDGNQYPLQCDTSGNLIGIAGNPGGANLQMQFNNGGSAFGGASGITTDSTHTQLFVSSSLQGVVQDKCGQMCNVLAYGADPTGVSDSASAFNAAIAAANGMTVIIPKGTYLLNSSVHITTECLQPGPKIQGAGSLVTTILLGTSFPGGQAWYPNSAFDISGVDATSTVTCLGVFAHNGFISGMTIIPQGYTLGSPTTTLVNPWISGVTVSGEWWFTGSDMRIEGMTGDAITYVYRSDLATLGDWAESDSNRWIDNHFSNNFGWGISLANGEGVSNFHSYHNYIVQNAAGGFWNTGWNDISEKDVISTNGCTTGTTVGIGYSQCSNSTGIPAGGVRVGRNSSLYGAGPIRMTLRDCTDCDSNFLYHYMSEVGSQAEIRGNRFIAHQSTVWTAAVNGSGVVTANGRQGENVPNISVGLGSITDSTNIGQIIANLSRSDLSGASLGAVPTAGIHSPITDGPVSQMVFSQNAAGYDMYDNTMGTYGESSESTNSMITSLGGGAFGHLTVTSGALTAAIADYWGIYYTGSPTPTAIVTGGDDPLTIAICSATHVTNGVIDGVSCTGGTGYHNIPAIGVYDTNGVGTGAVIVFGSVSGGVPTSPSISNGGSGYESGITTSTPTHTVLSVSAQCGSQPTVTPIVSNVLAYVKVTNGGNYGAWTGRSQAAPVVTVSATDSSGGSGWSGFARVAPVNIGTFASPNVVWQVINVDTFSAGASYTAATTTISFSSSATVSTAVATPFTSFGVGSYTISSAGSACIGPGGAVTGPGILGLLVLPIPVGTTNSKNMRVQDKNVNVTVPMVPSTPVVSANISSTASTPSPQLWNPGGGTTLGFGYASTAGTTTSGMAACVYHDYSLTAQSGVCIDETGSVGKLTSIAGGTDAAPNIQILPGASAFLSLGAGNTVAWTLDPTTPFGLHPTTAALETIGSSTFPLGDLYVGNSATNRFHLDVSALTALRVVKIPDAASNTVQPLGSATTGQVVQYIDNAGVQHLTPITSPTTVFAINAPVSNTGSTTSNQVINTARIPGGTMSATGKLSVEMHTGACTGIGVPFSGCTTGSLGSVTAISGGSGFSGTGTLFLTGFNNGCAGSTATVTITSGAFTSSSTTAGGNGCTAPPTTATCTSGTATCTGSPVSITVTTTAAGNTGTCTARAYLGTTNSNLASQLFSGFAVSKGGGAYFKGDVRNQNSVSSQQLDAIEVSGVGTQDAFGPPPLVTSFNTASDVYLNVTMTNSVSTDTCWVDQLDIVNWP